MRDGVRLRADIYRPDSVSSLPTLLYRTPYNARTQVHRESFEMSHFIERGFNIVSQDVRGRYGSEGEFTPFRSEGDDGADTVRWIRMQKWASSEVGMLGRSYAGTAQWLAAAAGANLYAIAPEVSVASPYDDWIYRSGEFRFDSVLDWILEDLVCTCELKNRSRGCERCNLEQRQVRSTGEARESALELLQDSAPYFREWLDHPLRDAYWESVSVRTRMMSVSTPALVVSGWFDEFLSGTLADYVELRKSGASAEARRGSRLLVGPWTHLDRSGRHEIWSFGACAGRPQLTQEYANWFADNLRDQEAAISSRPVKLFVFGANCWASFDEWPPLHQVRRLCLRSEGVRREQDPAGTKIFTYISEPLDRDLWVIGQVRVQISPVASRSWAPGCAELVNVYPSGEAMTISSVSRGEMLSIAGTGRICLGTTAVVFQKGNRARLKLALMDRPWVGRACAHVELPVVSQDF
jgi:uncharacterized protein